MRRLRVVAGQAQDVEAAELAALHQPPRLAVARVEAALEAELEADPGGLDLIGQATRLGQVDRQRLLAEDRDAALEPGADEGRVRARAGGDDERIGRGDGLLDARVRGADVSATAAARRGVGIGEDQVAGVEQVGQDRLRASRRCARLPAARSASRHLPAG